MCKASVGETGYSDRITKNIKLCHTTQSARLALLVKVHSIVEFKKKVKEHRK